MWARCQLQVPSLPSPSNSDRFNFKTMITFPLAFVDFEASSLEHDSYPIEVGVALVEHPHSIETWSTLISRTTSWRLAGHWSKKSQRIHGIAPEQLAEAPSARSVMMQLNTLLSAIGCAYCDGGDYDRAWLGSLSKAAGIEPEFTLREVDDLLNHRSGAEKAMRDHLAMSAAPHRAGPDAARLAGAILAAFNLKPPADTP